MAMFHITCLLGMICLLAASIVNCFVSGLGKDFTYFLLYYSVKTVQITPLRTT